MRQRGVCSLSPHKPRRGDREVNCRYALAGTTLSDKKLLMFDDELLQQYAATFYGYGAYTAPYWFIGMEEGGGNDPEQTIRRIEAWQQRGADELEDLAERNPTSRFFRQQPVAQPTWKQLIRLLLSSTARNPTLADIKLYQRDHPASRGISNDYYYQVGEHLSLKLHTQPDNPT